MPGARAYVHACVHPMASTDKADASLAQAQNESARWEQTAEAFLVESGKVILVGSTSEVLAEARRRNATVEDLDGRVVVPGFVDAHTHFLHIGVKRMRPALGGSRHRAEALARLVEWLRANPGDTPVIAEGWDESGWPDHAWLRKDELDAAARDANQPKRAIVARRICGHIATANTAALPLVRSRWDDDALVNPATGILLEAPSLYLNEVLPSTPAQLDKAIDIASRACIDLGITTVGDYSQAPYRAALLRAADAHRLPLRVASSIYVQQLDDEVKAGFRTGTRRGDALRDGGLKVFHDGSLGARSAALRAAYQDAKGDVPHRGHDGNPEAASKHGCVGHPHPCGTLNWSDYDVRRHYAKAHNAGIQLHAHAIGDAAVDQGLEAFATMAAAADLEGAGWNGNALRHRFEHYEIVHDEQAKATAELGILSSSQPNFVGVWSAKAGMYEERLGPRYRLNNRFVTWKQAGVPLAFGSDGMPPGPLLGLTAALQHPEEGERLTAAEAVWHYTWAAAWSLHWDDAVGSLEPGKWADFVVLSCRKLEGDLARVRVEATYVAGRKMTR